MNYNQAFGGSRVLGDIPFLENLASCCRGSLRLIYPKITKLSYRSENY